MLQQQPQTGRGDWRNKTPRVFLEAQAGRPEGPSQPPHPVSGLGHQQVNTGLPVQGFLNCPNHLDPPKARRPQQWARMCPHLRAGKGLGKDLPGFVSHERKSWNSLPEGVGSEPTRQSRPKMRSMPTGPSKAKLITQTYQSESPGPMRDTAEPQPLR